MLTFNAVLTHENIDPKDVRLVRHQDARAAMNCTPYDLWRAGDGRLELYQRIQKREVFSVGDLIATFVVTPAGDTLFVGFFRVDNLGIAPLGTIDPVLKQDRAGLHFYDIQRDERLSDYAWGKGYIQWVQRAQSSDKRILEIRREIKDEAFPGFTRFCCDVDTIEAIPYSWQEVLKHTRGVYL